VRDVDGVIPLALACFLLSYIESVSAARTLAARHGYEVDPRQELLGLSAANFVVAFGQGFPVAGGLSQSAVNDTAGAKSPLALVMASVTLAVCLQFLTGMLRNLPTVVLASVVLVAVRGLIDIKSLRRLRNVSRLEFRIAMVALVGVLLLGILKGVLLAAIVSLLLLISAAARPHVAFLGRIPGTSRFSDIARHPENESLPGVLLFRVEASLLYFNIDHVRSVVCEKVRNAGPLRCVVCDLSNSPVIDVAAARMFSSLARELAAQGMRLLLVEAHSQVRDLLRAEGVDQSACLFGRQMSVEQAITECEQPCPMPS
jgi:SulP family sulfate permease